MYNIVLLVGEMVGVVEIIDVEETTEKRINNKI